MIARWTALAMGCALGIGGCGGLDGSATGEEQAEVRKLLRNVRDVACTHRKDTTRCEVRVRKSPVGLEAWHCEFARSSSSQLGADSGSDACWTETGSRDNLRGVPPA
jgi:hypothetical protein